jgi:uncharacterized membrane protein
MKLNLRSGATIAITAAALIISGAPLIGAAHAEDAKGHCQGANACKGKGGCKTAKNDCKGHNGCKGQGWVSMTEDECKEAGGTFEKV